MHGSSGSVSYRQNHFKPWETWWPGSLFWFWFHLVPLSLSIPVYTWAWAINVQTRSVRFCLRWPDEFQMKPPALSFTISVCSCLSLSLPTSLSCSLYLSKCCLSSFKPQNLTTRHISMQKLKRQCTRLITSVHFYVCIHTILMFLFMSLN